MATKDISVIRDKKTGDIKNIRDKEIKDAKAKTAVAQTDAVRMKTVDDKEVYIDRNSLVQAIAEVMNSNSQSTIQTLFGADANGNHANINMANLASVLSAHIPILPSSYVDNPPVGIYIIASSDVYETILSIKRASARGFQIMQHSAAGITVIKFRGYHADGGWSSWRDYGGEW